MTGKVFSHIGISCKDPIRIEKFYTRYFGFKRARVYAPGPDQVVMLKLGDMYLELFKTEKNSPLPPPAQDGYPFQGLRHFCFKVDDLEAVLAELNDAARVTLGPLDMSQFIKGMKVAWIADPEGNIVELNQGYIDENNPPLLD